MKLSSVDFQTKGIKLALFDMDGTLFESRLDWPWIRKQLKIPEDETILESLYKNNTVDKKRLEILENHERENTKIISPIQGSRNFVSLLRERDIVVVLVTNNNFENTSYLLNKYDMSFHQVITREQKMWKPSPDAFIRVMKQFNFKPSQTISFGDSHYDIAASQAAHLSHIFIIADPNINQPQYPDVTYFNNYRKAAGG